MRRLHVRFNCFDCGTLISFIWGLTPTIQLAIENCPECDARYIVYRDGTLEQFEGLDKGKRGKIL